jgi:hypothetical protein
LQFAFSSATAFDLNAARRAGKELPTLSGRQPRLLPATATSPLAVTPQRKETFIIATHGKEWTEGIRQDPYYVQFCRKSW